MTDKYVPLEDWVENTLPGLQKDFNTHIKFLTSLDNEERNSLMRCLFSSLRQSMNRGGYVRVC